MKKKRKKIGNLIRIEFSPGHFAFARFLPMTQIAIYEYATRKEDDDINIIYNMPIYAIIPVMSRAILAEGWTVVDYRPLEPGLESPVLYFMRDMLNGSYSIYRSSDGAISPSTFEECRGLEEAAVWGAVHIEKRLREHFLNFGANPD